MRDHSGLRVSYEVVRGTQAAGSVMHVISTQANPLPTICPDGRPMKRMIMGRREFTQMVASENARRSSGATKDGLPREPVFFFYCEMPPPASTLYPAQMRLITQPFCNSANQRYIDCAQNAYRTREVEGCAVVPDYCQTSDFLQ